MTEQRIDRLLGETLSTVIFVGDYCQQDFNGPRLTAYVWPTIVTETTARSCGDSGYRDLFCSFIGHEVNGAQDRPAVGNVLDFEFGSIVINPEPSDLAGPRSPCSAGSSMTRGGTSGDSARTPSPVAIGRKRQSNRMNHRSAASVSCSSRDDPAVYKFRRDFGDEVEVVVVVQHGGRVRDRGGGEQEISHAGCAVVASGYKLSL